MERTITLPDDLVSEIEGTAVLHGKTVDQWLEEAIRTQLDDRKWNDLLEYGLKTGRESGYAEADIPGIVRARRRANAERS